MSGLQIPRPELIGKNQTGSVSLLTAQDRYARKQPCRTCRNYDNGWCESLVCEVNPDWKGCIRWKPMTDKRTDAQNRALHKYCEDVANALNDNGITMTMFFKEGYEVPFTKHIVKDHLWRPVQEAMFDVESTTELEKREVDKVYEVLNRKLSEHGIHVPFPTREE